MIHGHAPRRRFGQNFLADPHYAQRIVDGVDPTPGDNVVEIGPGLAALTGALIERAGHLAAIEIDRDLAARLRAQFPPEQLTLHEADALTFDFSVLGDALRIVVGNRFCRATGAPGKHRAWRPSEYSRSIPRCRFSPT